MKAITIDAGTAQHFRAGCGLNPHLIADAWDRLSVHHAVTDGTMLGTARLSPAQNGKLPFMEFADAQSVSAHAAELGRFVLLPFARKSLAGLRLFARSLEAAHERGITSIFVDSIVQPDVRHESLCRIGFERTNISYYDERYGALSTVFFAPVETVLHYVNKRAALSA